MNLEGREYLLKMRLAYVVNFSSKLRLPIRSNIYQTYIAGKSHRHCQGCSVSDYAWSTSLCVSLDHISIVSFVTSPAMKAAANLERCLIRAVHTAPYTAVGSTRITGSLASFPFILPVVSRYLFPRGSLQSRVYHSDLQRRYRVPTLVLSDSVR